MNSQSAEQLYAIEMLSPGSTLGTGVFLPPQHLYLDRRKLAQEQIEQEVSKLNALLESQCQQWQGLLEKADTTGQELIEADLMLLQDPDLIEEFEHQIRCHRCKIPHAISNVLEPMVADIEELDDPNLAKRAAELRGLCRNLIALAQNRPSRCPETLPENSIVIAEQVLPSEFLAMDNIAGLVIAQGSSQDHLAILARGAGIPVVRLPNWQPKGLAGRPILVCGARKLLVVNPDDENLALFESIKTDALPTPTPTALTQDGHAIHLGANIASTAELKSLSNIHWHQIDLLRTELLFLGQSVLPDAARQQTTYQTFAQAMHPEAITYRLFDFGSDKQLGKSEEANPALGWRGIRSGMRDPELYQDQLTALLNVAQNAPIKLLLPMVNQREELIWFLELLEPLLTQFKLPRPQLGIMVETPACAWNLANMADLIDFISIGSNDLNQYLFGADRLDSQLMKLYPPLNLGLLSQLKQITTVAKQHKLPIGLCGELGGDIKALPILLGLGINRLSMPVPQLPHICDAITKFELSKCRSLLEQALKCHTNQELDNLVSEFLQTHSNQKSEQMR